MSQNLWKHDEMDGPFYLSVFSIIITLLTLMFYVGATNRIQEIENMLNKKNTTIVDLHEKLEKLTDEYTKMDSDHVDDYNSLIEVLEEERKEYRKLFDKYAKLGEELTDTQSLHLQVKLKNEEFVKRIGRLESRLRRIEPKYDEL